MHFTFQNTDRPERKVKDTKRGNQKP